MLLGVLAHLDGPALDVAVTRILAQHRGDEGIAGLPDAPVQALTAVARNGSVRARKIVAARRPLPDTVLAILTDDRSENVTSLLPWGVSQSSKTRSRPTLSTVDEQPEADMTLGELNADIRNGCLQAIYNAAGEEPMDTSTRDALRDALLEVGPTSEALETRGILLELLGDVSGYQEAAHLLVRVSDTWDEATRGLRNLPGMHDPETVSDTVNGRAHERLMKLLQERHPQDTQSMRWEERQLVAAMKGTSVNLLLQLLADPEMEVGEQAAYNPETPLAAVSTAVFTHDIPMYAWTHRLENAPEWEAKQALADLLPAAVWTAMRSQQELPELPDGAYVVAATAENWQLRATCADHPGTPPALLVTLAKDADPRVVRAVLENPAAPTTAIIEAQVIDPPWHVYARLTDEDLLLLPWQVAYEALHTPAGVHADGQITRIQKTVAGMLNVAEAAHPGALTVVDTLAPDFNGTVTSLLQAASNL